MSTIEAISPFPIEELPRVWLWLVDAGSTLFNDQGPQTMDAFVDEWLARTENAITWGVYRDGELGGWVVYEPVNATTGNAHCVFRKAFFGWKVTLPALEQVATDLFAIGVTRIGMPVAMSNNAIQSLIRRLGARREADIARTYQPDGQVVTAQGEPLAIIQYGLYAEDWYAQRNNQPADVDADSRADSVSAA